MTAALEGIAVLSLLAVLNWELGRSVLYPPTLFVLLWLGLLFGSVLSGGRFLGLSVASVSVFGIGAAALSAGGALRLIFETETPRGVAEEEQPTAPRLSRLLGGGLVLLVLFFPLYWRHMLSIADPRFSKLSLGIRSGMIALGEVQGPKSLSQFFFDNITIAAILLALTAVAHYGEGRTWRVIAPGLVVVATLYNLATGSRAGAASVLLGAVGIRLMKRGGFTWRHVAAGALGVLVLFVPLTVLGSTQSGGVLAQMQAVGDRILLYMVSPLIAFDVYLKNPAAVGETWNIFYFFLHAANRLGFDVVAPSIHLRYVNVGPQLSMNVYTMYFAYFPRFGIAGVVVLSGLVGYMLVWLYAAASSRRDYLLILYGLAFNEILRSGFTEGFFLGLNLWVKAAAYCLGLYWLHRYASSRAGRRTLRPTSVCCG